MYVWHHAFLTKTSKSFLDVARQLVIVNPVASQPNNFLYNKNLNKNPGGEIRKL